MADFDGMYASGAGAAVHPVYLRVTKPKYYDSFRELLNAARAEGAEESSGPALRCL